MLDVLATVVVVILDVGAIVGAALFFAAVAEWARRADDWMYRTSARHEHRFIEWARRRAGDGRVSEP